MSGECSENHLLRKNYRMLNMFTANFDYGQIFDVFNCQLQERKQTCGFCKQCFDCKRFKFLVFDWYNIVCNSNR